MTLKLVWDGKALAADMGVATVILRHRKIMASVERLSESLCDRGGGGVIGERRLQGLMEEERQARAAVATASVMNLGDIIAKAHYLAVLVEDDAGALDADDLLAAFKSFAVVQPPKME